MRLFGLALLLALCAAPDASADEASQRATASQEFRRGVALANAGDLAAAVQAFETAYRTRPHYAVLYNLGQAYAKLDKPVEAVRAFEAFLRDGAGEIEATRRDEVEALVKRARASIGRLELAVSPSDSEVFLDGQRAVSVSGTIELTAGEHTVAARKEGYASRVESFKVRGGELVEVPLALTPAGCALGQLVIACGVPGVEIVVDGEQRGKTPFASPLLVPTGTRSVRFTRVGYLEAERSVAVVGSNPSRVGCALRTDFRHTKPSRLNVVPSESLAIVDVDGSRFEGAPLPPGPHTVSVERAGFVRWEQLVTLEPGGSRTIAVLLEPTPERRAELEARNRKQNGFAVGFGVTGVALLGTAVGLFIWNDGRYEDWRSESSTGDAPARAAELQRTDDIAAGLATLGLGALVTAGVLWLTNEGAEAPNK